MTTSNRSQAVTSQTEPASLERLAALIRDRSTMVLSGAGLSTESGIPDYRSPEQLVRRHKPMMYREFVTSAGARQRYWARGLVGWRSMSKVRPNAGHEAVAQLEQMGIVSGVVTQNVDGLHQAAGSRNVVELHGDLATVRCLDCGNVVSRKEFQQRLLELNPAMAEVTAEMSPDGDATVPDRLVESFIVPPCPVCGGVFKANVVFFGENVPKERVERAMQMLRDSEALLVVGSSLAVMSGMRFALRAADADKPLLIVNDGRTRADDIATLKVVERLGVALPRLVELLREGGGRGPRQAI